MGSVVLDEAFISVGPLLVGYTESLFNYDGILTIDDNNANGLAYSRGNVDQIRLSWAMNGFGLAISLEDPDKRLNSTYMHNDYGYDYYYDQSFPDIVAALTASSGSVSGKLSFVYSNALSNANYWSGIAYVDAGYVDWAVQLGLTFKLDSLAPGDKLLLAVAYGAAPFVAGNIGNGNGEAWWFDWSEEVWSVNASFQHFFAPNLSTAVSVSYAAQNDYWDNYFWGVHWNINYQPVKNLAFIPELRWHRNGYDGLAGDYHIDDWTAMLRIERYFP
jgi:hypothetical protein